jgi:hypothetical protein
VFISFYNTFAYFFLEQCFNKSFHLATSCSKTHTPYFMRKEFYAILSQETGFSPKDKSREDAIKYLLEGVTRH